MNEIHKISGIPFTDGGSKTEQTKEPEAAPATETENQQQPEDKKVLSNHVLMVIKKPRSQSLIPVYVIVNVKAFGRFRLLWSLVFGFIPLLPLLTSTMMSVHNTFRRMCLQERMDQEAQKTLIAMKMTAMRTAVSPVKMRKRKKERRRKMSLCL